MKSLCFAFVVIASVAFAQEKDDVAPEENPLAWSIAPIFGVQPEFSGLWKGRWLILEHDPEMIRLERIEMLREHVKEWRDERQDPAKMDEAGRTVLVLTVLANTCAADLDITSQEWEKIQQEARPRAIRYLKSQVERFRKGDTAAVLGIKEDADIMQFTLREIGTDRQELDIHMELYGDRKRAEAVETLKKTLIRARHGDLIGTQYVRRKIEEPFLEDWVQKISYEEIGTTKEEIQKLLLEQRKVNTSK